MKLQQLKKLIILAAISGNYQKVEFCFASYEPVKSGIQFKGLSSLLVRQMIIKKPFLMSNQDWGLKSTRKTLTSQVSQIML